MTFDSLQQEWNKKFDEFVVELDKIVPPTEEASDEDVLKWLTLVKDFMAEERKVFYEAGQKVPLSDLEIDEIRKEAYAAGRDKGIEEYAGDRYEDGYKDGFEAGLKASLHSV